MEETVATSETSTSSSLVSPLNFHWSGDGMRPDRHVEIKPLLAYLKSLSSTSLVLYKPKRLDYDSNDSIYGLLDQLAAEPSVPGTTLEEILSLALVPHNLYGFEDGRIIYAIMRLLRSHYQETSSLFNGSYGFLCISILIVALEVQVLILKNELDSYIKDTTVDPDDTMDAHSVLAATVSDVLYQNMLYWGRNPDQTHESLRVTEFLPADAGFLLMALTEERDAFPAARIAHPGRWPGWSVLFYMITMNLKDLMEFIPPDRGAMRMLQELTGRFGLIESEDEDDLIQMLSYVVDNPQDREGARLYGTASPQEDSELLTVAYMVRVACSATPPSIDLSYYLFKWIIVRLNKTNSNLLCGVMQASLSRLWIALEDDEYAVTTTEYANHIFAYSEAIYMDDRTEEKDIVALSYVLLDTGLVELFGRVLMLPTIHGRKAEDLFGEKSIVRKRTADFIQRMSSQFFRRFPSAKKLLAKSNGEWRNITN
ncbi:hypothetical protein BDV93DRAFT_605804 [Ceratobasidium sp. AG-I]|nr:hypothetical protein BDV93DRAFT_605804 [Ceratobasidium sp. AG-I]